jgi:hypothetical protein
MNERFHFFEHILKEQYFRLFLRHYFIFISIELFCTENREIFKRILYSYQYRHTLDDIHLVFSYGDRLI